MVPEVLADFKDLNGKDVPCLVSITQALLGKVEKLNGPNFFRVSTSLGKELQWTIFSF